MKKSFVTALLTVLFPLLTLARTYVVCVGISDYREINDLKLPEQDAMTMEQVYKANGADVILLTGRNATKSNILAKVNHQFAKAGAGDQIVLFFSGHGYQGGICPYDMKKVAGGGVTYRELRSALKQSNATQKIIIADACYSGGIRTKGKEQKPDGDSSVILFLSSRGGETSIENAWMKNGFFTTYLARGMRGGADTNGDKCITAKELFTFVSQGVKERSEDKQHPVMWGSFDDNFILMNWNK